MFYTRLEAVEKYNTKEFFQLRDNTDVTIENGYYPVVFENVPHVKPWEKIEQSFIQEPERVYVKNTVVLKDDALSIAKSIAISKTNNQVDEQLRSLVASYPEMEVLSWSRQETEARSFLKDVQVATPLLDSISAVRNIPKDMLASLIIQKSDSFAEITGSIIGAGQVAAKELESVQSLEQLFELEPGLMTL